MRILAMLIFTAAALNAQLTRGSISGTVRDSSGAVVVGAGVAAREQATGRRHQSVTNEAGVYRLAALEPGRYTVEFSKNGFDTARHETVAVDSAQEVVLNSDLAVATAATSVTVDAASEGLSLSRATPTIERRLDRETVSALPLTQFREVEDLMILTPGVTYERSVNGQRTTQNVAMLEGVDNSDPQFLTAAGAGMARTINIAPEGVEELHVRTNAYSADLGRGLGGQISIIGRRGANRVRGEVWDFYNAQWLSAPPLANERAGVRNSFQRHQAGAGLGGPIRKDKTFFFALFQAMPYRESSNADGINPITIPTPAGYAALASVPLARGQSAESRQAVLSTINFLPEIHAQVVRYESSRPVLLNDALVEFGSARIPLSRPGDFYRSQQRIDHRVTGRNTFSYFGSVLTNDLPVGGAGSNNTFGRRFVSTESILRQTHALGDTQIFSPTVVNEARFAFSRWSSETLAINDSGARTMVMGNFTLGPGLLSPFIRPRTTYEAQDVVSWTRGRHSLRFGLDLIQTMDTFSSNKQDVWLFPNFEAFLNNQPQNLRLQLTKNVLALRYLRHNYFVQDDIKVFPELTFNLGVRYQTASVPRGMFGAATPEIAAAGVPGSLERDTNDVAPRFGFAYGPRGGSGRLGRWLGSKKTVLRGGFGVAHGLVFEGESAGFDLYGNYPYNQVTTVDGAQVLNRYPDVQSIKASAPVFNPLTFSFINFPSNAKNSTTHFYSFSIQRQIGTNYFVEAGYTGNRSYHLVFQTESNWSLLTPEQALQVIATRTPTFIPSVQQRRLHPEWGPRVLFEPSAVSRYHAGYIKFDRRFTGGLLIGANYTWSGSFSNFDVGQGPRPTNPRNLLAEYGRSTLDRPHRFVVHYVWQTLGKRIWSGWRISGVTQWQSGQPFSINTGVDSNGDGMFGSDRPDYNPAGLLRVDPTTADWRTFESPLVGGRFVTPLNNSGLPLQFSTPNGGNLGRNTFRGPGLALWNLSVSKPFRITERVHLELRADSTNVFNHRNFGPPVASMNTLTFGTNTSDPPSRQVVVGVKLRF